MAKPAKATTATPTRAPRPSRVAAAARRKRQPNLLLIGGGLLVALVIGAVIFINVRRQQTVAGETIFAAQGNVHIADNSDSPLPYNSSPPTSGPHYPDVAPWRVHSVPQRYEQVVHNLEDGGVVIYYQCPASCPEIVQQLATIAEPLIADGRHVLVMPNDPTWTDNGSKPLHQDMGTRIAITAWTRLLKLDAVDETKIRAFIEKYEGLDHHTPG